MDLSEKRRLDAARQQVDKVKARARPWRSIAALLLAAIMAAAPHSARAAAASATFLQTPFSSLGRTWTEIAADTAAVAFCLLAYAATVGLAGKAREVLQPRIGTPGHGALRHGSAAGSRCKSRWWVRSGTPSTRCSRC